MTSSSLLKKIDECVYPADFLVARLHGRQGRLFRDWEFLITGSSPIEQLQATIFYPYLKKYQVDGIWLFLRQEHDWIYRRMNSKLRRIFEPYFIHQEVPVLVKVIRHIHAKADGKTIADQLDNSLLHSDLQKILTGGEDFHDVLHGLEVYFTTGAAGIGSLVECYEKNGLRGLERLLREKLFSLVLTRCTHPVLKTFFSSLIDLHNCMTLAKNIRWEIPGEHAYMDGGTVAPDKLTKPSQGREPAAAIKSLPFPGAGGEITSLMQLEKTLFRLITKTVHRWSRQRSTAGEILYYLWEQYRYARNISTVITTMHLGNELVRESIIT